MEQLPRLYLTREEMMKRVARFKDLKGFDGGLPDSKMPGCERTLFNVIGFQPPAGHRRGGVTSPVGDGRGPACRHQDQRRLQPRLLQGQTGPRAEMHNHDTNETFIAMTGTWRASWEDENGKVEYVDLDPLDVVSFPPGMIRRFENVTEGDPDEESILMFVIGGDGPQAEFTDQAMKRLDDAGAWARVTGPHRRAGRKQASGECNDLGPLEWRFALATAAIFAGRRDLHQCCRTARRGLQLDDRALLTQWKPSYKRGFIMQANACGRSPARSASSHSC